MINDVFFDLFFTLIKPDYPQYHNEFTILNLSMSEWEKYAEDNLLYQERALGLVKSESEIINKITENIPFPITISAKEEVLNARINRMKNALLNIPEEITSVLSALKQRNIKLGIISNADVIDCKYWHNSILFPFFDSTIFSCNVGILKPNRQIYELALHSLNVLPSDCIYIGDGGSNELYGAKSVGMKTIFTESLIVKDSVERNNILKYADYHVDNFIDILNYIK